MIKTICIAKNKAGGNAVSSGSSSSSSGGSLAAVSWNDLTQKPTSTQLSDILGDYYLKSSLISPWALAAAKPSYAFSEITGSIASSQLPSLYWADIEVSGTASETTTPKFGKVTIGGITLSVVKGKLCVGGDMYATGGVSAYGDGIDTPTGVSSFAELTEVVAASSPTAGQCWGWTGTQYGWITPSGGGGGGASSWTDITGRPMWLDAMVSSKPKVSAWQNDAGYLTSHQSLDGLVTIDTDQTITGKKTFNKGVKVGWDISDGAAALTLKNNRWISSYDLNGNDVRIFGMNGNTLYYGCSDVAVLQYNAGIFGKRIAFEDYVIDEADSSKNNYRTMMVIEDGKIKVAEWAGKSITDSYISSASNWNTAYGWGNHAVAGYLKSTDAASTYQPIINNLSTIISNANNGATAYGWGNHATEGYLKSVAWSDLTTKPSKSDLTNILGDMYWANVKVSGSSNSATAPTFASAVMQDASGKTTVYGGNILLKHSTPFIDFYGGNGSSYTSRLIDSGEGVMNVLGSGLRIGDWAAPLIWWDSAKNAYCINGNVYATGGISAYGGLGSYSSVSLTNLNVSNTLTTNKLVATEINIGNAQMWTDGDDWIYLNEPHTYIDSGGEAFFGNKVVIGDSNNDSEIVSVQLQSNHSKIKIVIDGYTRYINLTTS